MQQALRLNERYLLTSNQFVQYMTSWRGAGPVVVWASGSSRHVLLPVDQMQLAEPAVLQYSATHAKQMQLVNPLTSSTHDLPLPMSVTSTSHFQSVSWSPDKSHLVIIWTDTGGARGQFAIAPHMACTYSVKDCWSFSQDVRTGFQIALWSPDSRMIALWCQQKQHIEIIDVSAAHRSMVVLKDCPDLMTWAFSPDGSLLATCVKTSLGNVPFYHYIVYTALLAKVITTSLGVEAGGLPHPIERSNGGHWVKDSGTPVWAMSSAICWLPFSCQVFRRGQLPSVRDVPVTHRAHLSPCGSLITSTTKLATEQHGSDYTCPTHHYHNTSRRLCKVMGEWSHPAENSGLPWMSVARLPYPLGSQVYAFNAARACSVHLIDGRSDTLCCSWHIPSMVLNQTLRPIGGLSVCEQQCSTVRGVRLSWSPDGRSLAIADWSDHPLWSALIWQLQRQW